jgi:hypothetical protein
MGKNQWPNFLSLGIYLKKVIIVMANNTGIKYGGRQKGTANKATARIRDTFAELLEGNMEECKNSSIKWQKIILRRH